ncbi:MAG: prepilin-type N-terminal cleavage/methylation domain-containing protein [Ruminococcus sp.]|nr:prepilin-type N-terminal cleavage/methylation domain-containing protein [Ruminococcus sp.]
MKLSKHNKKGMTLAECIIAMALLGAMSGMLVTIAVAAKRQNVANYFRANEMYEQAAEIEEFNPDVTYAAKFTKVSYLVSTAAGATGNEFNLVADFGTYKLDTLTYGYKALPTGTDKNRKNYTLKALKSEFATVQMVPSPASGRFVVKLYNYAGQPLTIRLKVPDAGGGIFFNADETSISGDPPRPLLDGAIDEIGFSASTNNTLFEVLDETADGQSLLLGTITKSSLGNWGEHDAYGQLTGYIPLYLYNDGTTTMLLNESDYNDIKSDL